MKLMTALSVFCLSLVTACSYNRGYVWVDELEPEGLGAQPYRIRPGDLLAVSVWNQENLSGEVRVREDGKATLPLLGDVEVGGGTAPEAAQRITQSLNGVVLDPKVTVAVVEVRPPTITVVGEVRAPGAFPLVVGDRVLEAVARAGGPTEFAELDEVFVIRKQGDKVTRVRFDLVRVMRAEGRGLAFVLQDGDVIVVQ